MKKINELRQALSKVRSQEDVSDMIDEIGQALCDGEITTEDAAALTRLLALETEKKLSIRELRSKYDLTQTQLSYVTKIPMRTIQNWEGGQRECPEYVRDLVQFKLQTLYGDK